MGLDSSQLTAAQLASCRPVGSGRTTMRWILLPFVAVTASFLVGTVAVEALTARIGAAANTIANDDALGIQFLVAAQNEVRRAESILEQQAVARRETPPIAEVQRAQRRIDDELHNF